MENEIQTYEQLYRELVARARASIDIRTRAIGVVNMYDLLLDKNPRSQSSLLMIKLPLLKVNDITTLRAFSLNWDLHNKRAFILGKTVQGNNASFLVSNVNDLEALKLADFLISILDSN